MTQKARHQPHRWFIYSSAGLFVLLSLSIIFAAMILLRRGYVARRGMVTGSSMEPTLKGPRLRLRCYYCEQISSFAWDTCRIHRPFQCSKCNDPDMAPGFDLEVMASRGIEVSPGEQIDYGPLRMIRALRTKNPPPSEMHPTGICRGDLVVFQDPTSSIREIKRIVGFPTEKISIDQGDLFVNGNRYKKSIPELLNQAVLVSRWDHLEVTHEQRWKQPGRIIEGKIDSGNAEEIAGTDQEHSLAPFGLSYESSHWIDNQLAVNAHDSHRICSVNDIGVAIQLGAMTEQCSMKITLTNSLGPVEVLVKSNATHWEIQANETETTAHRPANQSSVWCVVAICDGDLIVGCETEEWFRTALSHELQNGKLEPLPLQIVSCELTEGELQITQSLLFRDLYYRGANDTDSQDWEAGERVVVLGDNVSCSSDSRDRWENGLGLSTIKGVVIRPKNPMENLLQQSN